jgi:hypothetical protein
VFHDVRRQRAEPFDALAIHIPQLQHVFSRESLILNTDAAQALFVRHDSKAIVILMLILCL